MTQLTLWARLVLGAVFVVAGTAKSTFTGRIAFERGLRGFGVGRRLTGPLAVWLPRAEIALGALLLAGLAVRAAALLSLSLLLVFSAALARVLARRETVNCGCFGMASARPVGPATLLRNGALAALAVASAFEGSFRAPWGTADSTLPVVLLACGVLAGAALLTQLERLRHH